jgi:toxin ParE1/3/4
MAFRVEFSADAERDFEIIVEFLVQSYLGLGEDAAAALARAESRVLQIRRAAESLSLSPYRGTLHDHLLPGLRHITMERAIFWFKVDEDDEVVRVVAIFFGGQDHHRRMLARLLE